MLVIPIPAFPRRDEDEIIAVVFGDGVTVGPQDRIPDAIIEANFFNGSRDPNVILGREKISACGFSDFHVGILPH